MIFITPDEIDMLRGIRDGWYAPEDWTGELDTLIRDLEELQDYLEQEEEHENLAKSSKEWEGIP